MKISVVIPVFNAEAWIEETLTSVREQIDDIGKENVELLVVDDRSQDRSPDLARQFLANHGLAGRVITTEDNQGPSDARNLGWRSATAEWIQFLDADDLLGAGKFQRQLAGAESVDDDVAVVYSPYQHFGLVDGRWSPHGPVIRSNVDDDSLSRIFADYGFGYVGPTLVRRSALEAVGGFSTQMKLGEDYDLMLRIAMSGLRFQLVPSPEPLFFYRDTPNSLWRRIGTDVGPTKRLVRSIRDAENYLRNSPGNPMSAEAILGLGIRYAGRLDVLVDADPEEFRRVLTWITELRLKSAPPGTYAPVRVAARIVGLGNALRLKFAVRKALRTLRVTRTDASRITD
jgi:glycosyltransferase involved in cell wall biosynthesis